MCFYKKSYLITLFIFNVLYIYAADSISFSTGTVILEVDTAIPGSQPDDVIDTISYNITVDTGDMKITGSIDSSVPDNTTLYVNLIAPSGAVSEGDVALTTSEQDLVTGIFQNGSDLDATFTLSSTVEAGVFDTSRLFTVTITTE